MAYAGYYNPAAQDDALNVAVEAFMPFAQLYGLPRHAVRLPSPPNAVYGQPQQVHVVHHIAFDKARAIFSLSNKITFC